LTFHIKNKTLLPCAGGKFKATGSVTLDAEVGDLEVWDTVIERLDNMTVHTVHDVAGALVAAARKKTQQAEQVAVEVTEDSRKRMDKLEADKSFLEQDAENLRRQLIALQENYNALDEYVKTMEG